MGKLTIRGGNRFWCPPFELPYEIAPALPATLPFSDYGRVARQPTVMLRHVQPGVLQAGLLARARSRFPR